MNNDFRDLNLDKPLKRDLKTVDEIKRHTVEGYLDGLPIDRALHLLTLGDELQRKSIMKILPSLIKEDFSACVQRVVPVMEQTLSRGTTGYNLAACKAIRNVASQNLMPAGDFSKVFLQHILNSLDNQDADAARDWFNTLLDIIPILPTNVLQNEVLPIAVSRAHISKDVPFRINSCRILGRLALTFPKELVKMKIAPIVYSLCQDVSGEVRAAMASELPNISAALGQDTSAVLMTHILDLNLDEDLVVQEALLGAIADMIPRFSANDLKTSIIPYAKRVFPQIIKNENKLLLTLSQLFGKYSNELKSVMSESEKEMFIQYYIQLSQMNVTARNKLNPYRSIVINEMELAERLTECRVNCAHNYPAMVLFATGLKKQIMDDLLTVFRNLTSDSFYVVRRKIAAGFFEVMKLMPRWLPGMKVEFVKLLKDDIENVLEGLVPNIGKIVLEFSARGAFTADSGKRIGQALLDCEINLSESHKWRIYENLLLELRVIPKVFPPEFVFDNFVLMLQRRAINMRVLPCRLAALHTLLVILSDPSQESRKHSIRDKIIVLCKSSVFQCRLLFLKGMSILITMSPNLVKQLFFNNITSMAGDKVANIRLVLCQMLPKLKSLAMDQMDGNLRASVDAAVSTLAGEKDRDVIAQLKIAVDEMMELDRSKGIRRPEEESDPFRMSPRGGANLKPAHFTCVPEKKTVDSSLRPKTTNLYSTGDQLRTVERQNATGRTTRVMESPGEVRKSPPRSQLQRPNTSRNQYWREAGKKRPMDKK